ncbi:hypothetical protein BK138_16070 [Paenibacillus rhizosphaerae]|uniref:Uncharacterized protein n=1 Tax=Paenibacillus rhizosphaerae TaxID=297318 RepID=A0A1R1ES50_9BACL|nr:hypothetical protein [Paenibacillus rhizosphaerae]OMF54674.1 hypothetical protein BK138_16070 [Paenibacillus rhizosphaerae]
MIEVSKAYKEAVYAPIRKAAAKVKIEILDNDAYLDNTVAVSSEAALSRTSQISNKVRTMSSRYATFEKDYFRLDGSFCIPPKPNVGNSELGWWSSVIADQDGLFSPVQTVTWTFAEEHSSMGLSVSFDPIANEYAADFDVDVYRADGTQILHQVVVDNQSPLYVFMQGIDNYAKVVLTIRKWAKPFRRARVTEMDFGVVQEYTGQKLIKLNVVEQMNVVSDTLPANEIRFTIDNSDKEFNILNPTGYYRFLKDRQEVSFALGIEIEDGLFEYIDMKRYYLVDWQSDEGALTTTFIARDILELLDQKSYQNSYTGTLFGLAQDIMTSAGVDSYFVDPGLQAIPTNGFIDKLTARKALQCIGIAAKAAVYQDREGVLNIRRFEAMDDRTTYLHYAGEPDMYAGIAYVEVDRGYDMKNITFDNVYQEPQIKLDSLLMSLTVSVYTGANKQDIVYTNPGIKEGTSLRLDNPLIQSTQLAADVANWIISESNQRALYQVNWRQNPCLETGDIVIVEDSFGAKKQSRITKQEFEFAGYLSGRTETKGGV